MESDNDDVHINDMCSSILKTIKYLLDIPELSTESQYIKSNEFSIKLYNLHSQVNFLYAIMRKCNFSWDIIHNDHNHILNVNQNTKMQHISNNINTIGLCINELENFTIKNFDIIISRITCNSADMKYESRTTSLFICLYIILSRLSICFNQEKSINLNSLSSKSRISQVDIKASDFPLCNKYYLCITRTPILLMDLRELLESIDILQHKWWILKYHPSIDQYVRLLEYRFYVFCNEAFSRDIINMEQYSANINLDDTEQSLLKKNSINDNYYSDDDDDDIMNEFSDDIIVPKRGYPSEDKIRKTDKKYIEKTNDPLLAINDECIWTYSCILQRMKMRISYHFVGEHSKIPNIYKITREEETSVKNWLISKTQSLFSDQISVNYRNIYMPLILEPGEYEKYILKYILPPTTIQEVYKYTRGKIAVSSIQEFLVERSDEDPLKDDESLNPYSVFSMTYVLIKNYFESRFKGSPFSNICIKWPDIPLRSQELLYEKYPIIIQSFNYANVFFKGKLYITNGIYRAIALFLKICEIEFQGTLNNELNIFPLYGEIYGPSIIQNIKQKWAENNLQKSNLMFFRADDLPLINKRVLFSTNVSETLITTQIQKHITPNKFKVNTYNSNIDNDSSCDPIMMTPAKTLEKKGRKRKSQKRI